MRILQSLYDAGGGVPPQLAVTRRLVERGHQVTVLAHETLRGRVEERGASFVPFRAPLPGHDMTRAETDLVRDWEPADPAEGAVRFRDLVLFGPARANADEVLEVLRAHPADVVLLDWLLFGTALAAERAGLPAVTLVHCPYPLRTSAASDAFFAPGLAVLNDARRDLGLAPLEQWDEQLLRTEAVLLLAAPELDAASGQPLPVNVRYVGPATEPPPSSWQPEGPDPLLLLSFSTTFMDQGPLVQRVLAAVADLPVQALLTAGPSLDLTGISIPSNVRCADWVPHAAVLPHASLVVTHAGFGTVQAALAAGVPLVCLPSGRDQPANAARVAALGAGVAPDLGSSLDDLRECIRRAVNDASLHGRARELAAHIATYDGTRAVVAELESL